MALTTIEQASGQWTVVNTDQITYIREDTYGTAIHFSSGEHIICSLELNDLLSRLAPASPEMMLTRPS
ncbi:hypothetical protein H7F51_11965 [Novosphingobium flavum]|uniref:Uncharacterized protein n=1 Tax=Novosphingobium flavum TaxID=1778672 RepID=A0A7X1FSV6_9SPHN|nr:hypothetical protein [Novosphingobium flavum]MBC2666234.1 hypothetical protein [Novosphingobium flavum]